MGRSFIKRTKGKTPAGHDLMPWHREEFWEPGAQPPPIKDLEGAADLLGMPYIAKSLDDCAREISEERGGIEGLFGDLT